MVVRSGRFGRFLACQSYPECKNTRPLPVGVRCPEEGCGGDLTERRTRKGRLFYGCSRYPECKFATWDRPVPGPCAVCGSPALVEKNARGGHAVKCPRCGHTTGDLAPVAAEAGD
jgi:DNA topoisomerase-1